MDRAQHPAHHPRSRLGLLPGRARHRPPPGLRHTPTRPLRQLHTLPPGMPHRRAPRPAPARRPTLPVLPHHRTPRPDSPRSSRPPVALHLRLRPLPGSLPLEPLRPACRRTPPAPPPGPPRHAPPRLGKAQPGGLPHAVQRLGRETGQIRRADTQHPLLLDGHRKGVILKNTPPRALQSKQFLIFARTPLAPLSAL